jgi:hypothetical protein
MPSDSVTFSLPRKRALILLGIATVAFTVILGLIDPSHVSHGPTILDFEFVVTRSRAAQIMTEWGPKGRSAAHLSLLLDYGYMLSYGLFFALAGFAVRDTARARGWQHLATLGVVVPFFVLVRRASTQAKTLPSCSRSPATAAAAPHRSPPFARRSSSRSLPSPSSTWCAASRNGSERASYSRAEPHRP